VTVYVRLRVAAEAYAIPVGHVLEVASLGEVRAVPRARPEVLGVRSLRGRILPVIDLALLLGITRPAAGPPGRLLVAAAGDRQAGLAIDEVSAVGELPGPGPLAEPPESGLLTEPGLLTGALLADGDLVGLIDVPAVLAAVARPR
jgi:purine-binding chemotaxis protein CheW